jgi:hypothetical protein
MNPTTSKRLSLLDFLFPSTQAGGIQIVSYLEKEVLELPVDIAHVAELYAVHDAVGRVRTQRTGQRA